MDFRPVQDVREVNKRVSDIHPMVPNPYTVLSAGCRGQGFELKEQIQPGVRFVLLCIARTPSRLELGGGNDFGCGQEQTAAPGNWKQDLHFPDQES